MRKDLMLATALGSATFAVAWSGQAVAQSTPNYNWSGSYVGGAISSQSHSNAAFVFPDFTFPGSTGVGFINNAPQFWEAGPPTYAPWPTEAPLSTSVGITGNYGVNVQHGSFVYGTELDATLSSLGTFSYHSEEPGPGRVSDFNASGGIDALFTFRPRIGIAANRLLLYATGGLAIGRATFSTDGHLTDSGKGMADWSGSTSAWKAGYVIGGGGEYAVTNKVGIKFEALYYNLGSIDVTANGTANNGGSPPTPVTPVESYTGTMQLQGAVARVGVTFHLN